MDNITEAEHRAALLDSRISQSVEYLKDLFQEVDDLRGAMVESRDMDRKSQQETHNYVRMIQDRDAEIEFFKELHQKTIKMLVDALRSDGYD